MQTFKRCGRAEEAFKRAFETFQSHEPQLAERFRSSGRVYFAAKDVEFPTVTKRDVVFFTLGKKVQPAVEGVLGLTLRKKCEAQLFAPSSEYSFCTTEDGMAHFITFDSRPIIGPGVFLETDGHDILGGDAGRIMQQLLAMRRKWPVMRVREPMRELLGIISRKARMEGITPRLTFEDKVVWGGEDQLTDKQLDRLTRLIGIFGLGSSEMIYVDLVRQRTQGYLELHTHTGPTPMSITDLAHLGDGMFWKRNAVTVNIQMIGRQVAENEFDMLVLPFFRYETMGTFQPLLVRAAYLHERYGQGRRPTPESVAVLGSIMDIYHLEEMKTELESFGKAISIGEKTEGLVNRWNTLVAQMGREIDDFPHRDWKALMDSMNGGVIDG